MKKLLCVAIALLFAAAMQAQEEEKDITKFLGIPVEGNKPAMIKKLKAKGFTRSIWDKDVLEGEFNGEDVQLYVVTNNKKVWRIALRDKYTTRDEREIKQRFNRLCEQFKNNPKYDDAFLGTQTIPNDENLGYEITVNNKHYIANFYQLPDSVTMEQLLGWGEEALEFEKRKRLFLGMGYKHVWFRIFRENDGEYCIWMYYDNEYNKADGEDL